jgi:hypothetical protein
MVFLVGTKVRFRKLYKPPLFPRGGIGTIVDIEERPARHSGLDYWVRVRFDDVLTPWIEGWKLERVD